jgi:hypothetical protein
MPIKPEHLDELLAGYEASCATPRIRLPKVVGGGNEMVPNMPIGL